MKTTLRFLLAAVLCVSLASPSARACPFCSAETRTLSEELADSDVVVLATLVEAPPESKRPTIDPETGEARFRIKRALRGGDQLKDAQTITAIFFGEPQAGDQYFVRGVGSPVEWAIPIALSSTAVKYVEQLDSLPAEGADRLAFFQDFLEHEEPLLAQDAYDEFARASYQALKDLKPRMQHDRIVTLLQNPQTSPSRRRLFFTMLGVCGDERDVPLIEQMLLSDVRIIEPAAQALTAANLLAGGPLGGTLLSETLNISERQEKLGLDAMVACYLTLVGEAGMDKIDARFLKDKTADYSHVYSVLQAIRFLAEEESVDIPRARILQSARLLLDSPDFADQVIPDLARWEDWSVLDRLVEMYVKTDELGYQKFVREPIVTYLDVAAEQESELADRALAGLKQAEEVDPAAFKRARSLRAFGFLGTAQLKKKSDEPKPEGEGVTAKPPAAGEKAAPTDDGAEPPDPVTATAEKASWESPTEETAAAEEPAVKVEPQAEPAAALEAPPASEVAPVVRSAPPIAPAIPSPAVRIGVPLGAAAIFCGLFWIILRGPA